MLENKFGTAFRKWYLKPENKIADSAAFEYKITYGGTYNLKQWRKKQGHQEANLKKFASKKGIFHTFTDLDLRGTPADAFFMSNAPSYLVIWYDKYKEFFLIPVAEIPTRRISVSYKYCKEHWEAFTLLLVIKKKYKIYEK